jgi:hypothetical protein
MSDNQRRTCSSCSVNLPVTEFNIMRTGNPTKTCKNCLNHQKQSRERNKCEHGKKKNICRDCGGVSFCIHNKRKTTCAICGGGSLCEHKRPKHQCGQCGTGLCEHGRLGTCRDCGHKYCTHERQQNKCRECGDPIKITILKMIQGSKWADKKSDRYDANNFIDYCFMEQLLEDEGRTCCYCEVELQYVERKNTLGTIERIDNSIGHTKANVRIACLECNTRRVGQRLPETS